MTATIATTLLFWVDQTHNLLSLRTPLLLGFWLIPLLALLKLQLEMARSIRQIFLAYAPFFTFYPLLLILAAFAWQQTQERLTSSIVILICAFVLVVVLMGQLWFLAQELPSEASQVAPAYRPRQWLLVALPILFIDSSFIVLNQTDTLMIAAFLGTTEVGIYGAAFKTAGWVSFILVSVNAIAAPLFGALYAQGDRQALQQLVSTIAHWMFYPALGIAIGLFIFSEPILHWFGPEFGVAKWSLTILALGQLVNVGTGSVGYLLMMTGHHNPCAAVFGCSALVNIGLNLVGWTVQSY
jgi:O-antigen/teichoic acid export membrane protein